MSDPQTSLCDLGIIVGADIVQLAAGECNDCDDCGGECDDCVGCVG